MSLFNRGMPEPNPDVFALNFMRLLYGNTQTGQNQTPQQTTLPQYNNNLIQQINPYYTQQQPYDSLNPMKMFQQYKQTGILPQENQTTFTPYTPPPLEYQSSQPTTTPVASAPLGGK